MSKPALPTNQAFMSQWQKMKEQATVLVRSGFLPDSIKTAEQCIAIMMKGQEIGMKSMQALSQINVIKGKPTLSAEAMLAVVFKAYPGTQLDYLQNDDQACMIEVTKPHGKPNHFSFTIEDAKKAQLLGNPSWQKYTRAMLRSRCISEMCRAMFPDAIQGCSYTPEEVLDIVANEKREKARIQAEKEFAAQAKIIQAPETNSSPAQLNIAPTMRELFAQRGISEEDLKEFLGKSLEERTDEDTKDLREAYNKICEGKMQRDDFLEFGRLRKVQIDI